MLERVKGEKPMFIEINNAELINIAQVESIRKSFEEPTSLIVEFKEGSRRIYFNSVDSRDNAFDIIKDNIVCTEIEHVVRKDY